MVLGSVEDKDLLALKRVAPSRRRNTTQQVRFLIFKSCDQISCQTFNFPQITFFTPEVPCRVIYRLFVVSDSYLGLDQQYDLHLDVEEGFAEVL